jgi:hypothetical protein
MRRSLDYENIEETLLEIQEGGARKAGTVLTKAYLDNTMKSLLVEKKALTADYHQYVKGATYAGVVDLVAALAYLLGVFLSFPLWAQVALAVIILISVAITVFFLWKSGDAFGNLIKIIDLMIKIWEIINDIKPTCPAGQHWDDDKKKCVDDTPTPPTPPVSADPPGVAWTSVGTEPVAQIGGVHQEDIPKWQLGGDGWPGGTSVVVRLPLLRPSDEPGV